MATSAQYTTTPGYSCDTVTTADTSYTAPTNYKTILTGTSTAAGSGVGYRINKVICCVKGTSSQCVVRFFMSTDNLTTQNLIDEIIIPANTASSTAPAVTVAVPFLEGLVVPGSTGGNAFKITASTSVTQNIAIHVFYGAL